MRSAGIRRTNFQFNNKIMSEEQNINEPQNPAFLQGAVMRSADGHSVDDDMHWTVICPTCERELEYTGYFDSGDTNKCKCGTEFKTRRVYFYNDSYME
jgi:hypothetical protein